MARDGSGGYSLPEAAFVNNTVIDEVAMNSNFSDIATEIANSVDKDGQTVWTGDMDAGGNLLTNIGDAVLSTSAASLGQVTGGGKGPSRWGGTVGGTVDVITLTPSAALGAYASGVGYIFISAGTNTTAVTVNVSGLGAVALKKKGGNALVAGDLPAAGGIVHIIHDGTDFEWANHQEVLDVSFNAGVGTGQSFNAAGAVTVNFNSEIHDTASAYDGSNTFTAPKTGKYQFNINLHTSSSSPVADDIWSAVLVTTARSYSFQYVIVRSSAAQGFAFSVIADMTAADTAYVTMGRATGTGSFTTTSSGHNFFSAHLIK